MGNPKSRIACLLLRCRDLHALEFLPLDMSCFHYVLRWLFTMWVPDSDSVVFSVTVNETTFRRRISTTGTSGSFTTIWLYLFFFYQCIHCQPICGASLLFCHSCHRIIKYRADVWKGFVDVCAIGTKNFWCSCWIPQNSKGLQLLTVQWMRYKTRVPWTTLQWLKICSIQMNLNHFFFSLKCSYSSQCNSV